jgi:hypothetical protein
LLAIHQVGRLDEIMSAEDNLRHSIRAPADDYSGRRQPPAVALKSHFNLVNTIPLITHTPNLRITSGSQNPCNHCQYLESHSPIIQSDLGCGTRWFFSPDYVFEKTSWAVTDNNLTETTPIYAH